MWRLTRRFVDVVRESAISSVRKESRHRGLVIRHDSREEGRLWAGNHAGCSGGLRVVLPEKIRHLVAPVVLSDSKSGHARLERASSRCRTRSVRTEVFNHATNQKEAARESHAVAQRVHCI